MSDRVELKIMVTPEEKVAIENLLQEMRAKDCQPPELRHFLARRQHLIIYKEHVLKYYHQYIRGQQLSHKQLMLHYAAIYYAIAYNTGISTYEFHGPDFDRFMYEYCGITYNQSDTARGRYRQVKDVFDKYSPMIRHGAQLPTKASELKARKDFLTYKDNMRSIILSRNSSTSYRAAQVPGQLE